MLSWYMQSLCVRPSVCPSITSLNSPETAKRWITQAKPHNSTGSKVFCCQRSWQNCHGVTPKRRRQVGWVKISYISETVQILERVKLESSNFVYRLSMSSVSLDVTNCLLMGVVRVTWPIFKISVPKSYFWKWWSYELLISCADSYWWVLVHTW